MDRKLGQGIEYIRFKRRTSAELVIFSVILASLVNALISCFINAIGVLLSDSKIWYTLTLFFLGVTVLFSIISLYFFLVKPEVEKSGFSLLIPVGINSFSQEISVLTCMQYTPSIEIHKLLMSVNKDIRQDLYRCWKNSNGNLQDLYGKENFFSEVIKELIEALLIIYLRKFGDVATGISASYHAEFRRFSSLNPKAKYNLKIEKIKNNNRFLKERKLENIKFPFNVKFGNNECKYFDHLGDKRKELTLKFNGFDLTFCISPYWSALKSKNVQIKIENNLINNGNYSTLMIVVPVEICLKISALSKDNNIEDVYEWIQALIVNSKRRMGLGNFLINLDSVGKGRVEE